MAVRYFCDVCKKEIPSREMIHIMGVGNSIRTLCIGCWQNVERFLLESRDSSLHSE